jgi:hypothetical protein
LLGLCIGCHGPFYPMPIEIYPPLPKPFDPWKDGIPTIPVPEPLPKDVRNCEKIYSDDLYRCEIMNETNCYFGIDFDKTICRAKAFTRYRACRRIFNPPGSDWGWPGN